MTAAQDSTPTSPYGDVVPRQPDVREMIVIHRALTREFGLLPALVGAVPPGNGRRAKQIAAHIELAVAFLHAHHDGEDRLLWPVLLTRLPRRMPLVELMEGQHAAIAALSVTITRELAEWARMAAPEPQQALLGHLTDLAAALHDHLQLEEADILPLVPENLTVAEWKAPFEYAQHHTPVPASKGLLLVGMVLEDALPDERRWFVGHLPVIARVAWQLVGRRQYRRYATSIRKDLPSR